MAAWLPVIIGLATGMSLIFASIWWTVHAIGLGRKVILPKARETGHKRSDAAEVYGAGNDDS